MKNKLYTAIVTIGLITSVFSCTSKFDEMNTNPVEPTEVPPKMSIGRQEIFGNISEWSAYQMGYTLYSSLYSQYFANTANYFNSGRYLMNLGWIENAFYKTSYVEAARSFYDIEKYAQDIPGYENHYWISRVQFCLTMARLTDHIGDTPYFEGGKGVDFPKYDTQETIYKEVLNGLDSAYVMLGKNTDSPSYGSEDLIYNGDLNKWRKLANSLMLRYAVRVSKVDPSLAEKYGKLALSRELISTFGESATILTDPTTIHRGHPLYEVSNWNEFRMSNTMQKYLTKVSSASDPRLYLYFRTVMKEDLAQADFEKYAKLNDDGLLTEFKYTQNENGSYDISYYKGLQNGLPANELAEIGNTPSDNSNIGPMFENDTPYKVMGHAEVYFLKASAALYGWGGDAKSEYEKGIKASWEYASSLSQSQSFISNIEDPSKLDIDAYIAGLPSFETNPEENIELQKWISIYPDGGEGWASVRKSDYPKLTPIAKNDSGVDLGEDGFIKKLPYTEAEITINAANALNANNNQGQGDGINVRVWWDVK